MDIILYNFTKRENSTKTPSNGKYVSGKLNNNCSIINPTIDFSENNLYNYNYAYISKFKRYYYIVDWVYKTGYWEASLQCDVLASFKSQIGNSSQYIIRSSAEYDTTISDTLYPAKADIDTGVKVVDAWNNISGIISSYFIVGIVGDSSNANTGIVTYYQMTESQFTTFSNMVFGTTEYLGSDFGSTMTLDLLKTQVNPFQYIVSVYRFPFKSNFANPVSTIKIGWWNIELQCEVISTISSVHTDKFVIDIPKHPQSGRGKYLSLSPYTKYLLYVPFFGTKEIPPEFVYNIDKLYILVETDIIANKSYLYLTAGEWDRFSFMQYAGQIGQSVIIGQSTTNYLGAATSVLGTVNSIVKGNFMGAISSIGNTIENLCPTLITNGENTGYAELTQPVKLLYSFTKICDEDIANNGKPLMKVKRINTISGYIKCENSDISINGTNTENALIKDYLNGGFFYE